MGLRDRAFINGCADPKSSWQPISPEDPYAKNGTGSSNAERLHFGSCSGGEVVGYRGRDEGHVLSFKTHFDPKISGYDTTWNFLQGKTKHGKYWSSSPFAVLPGRTSLSAPSRIASPLAQ